MCVCRAGGGRSWSCAYPARCPTGARSSRERLAAHPPLPCPAALPCFLKQLAVPAGARTLCNTHPMTSACIQPEDNRKRWSSCPEVTGNPVADRGCVLQQVGHLQHCQGTWRHPEAGGGACTLGFRGGCPHQLQHLQVSRAASALPCEPPAEMPAASCSSPSFAWRPQLSMPGRRAHQALQQVDWHLVGVLSTAPALR